MKTLFINPHEYNYNGLHHCHTYPTELYNWATEDKANGNDAYMFDMNPEGSASMTDEKLSKDGVTLVECTGMKKKCGNYENEKLVKSVLRVGLPIEMLEDKLKSMPYDKIVICAQGSKTCITSTSWRYVFKGVCEVIDLCKKIQKDTEIVLIGEYAKMCPEVAKECGTDIAMTKPSADKHFINTDISLFDSNQIPRRINIATSYGCSNECTFCSIPIVEGSIRIEKPVEDVLNYMKYLSDNGITRLRFLDSNLLFNYKNHLKLILEGIVKNKWNFDLSSYGGIEPKLLTEPIAKAMVEAGFKTINVPLDNTDQSILDKFGRKKDRESWIKAADIAVKYFESVRSYQMIGFPDQTYENAMESVLECESRGIVPALCPFSPLPSTIFEDKSMEPEDVHCLLFPYASPEFTVRQMEEVIIRCNDWYTKSAVDVDADKAGSKIYKSSQPIIKK